jgi:predicted acylesterase/phospholipase RssA
VGPLLGSTCGNGRRAANFPALSVSDIEADSGRIHGLSRAPVWSIIVTTYPLDPSLSCDILMKGGITSGVIYPHAVCELARSYRLRSVGGSSAGAIAAAATAAAEHGRGRGGFDRLERLPTDLMTPGRDAMSLLFRLFQPQSATAGLYRAFVAGLGHRGLGRWLRTLWGALKGFPGWAGAGALPGTVLVVLGALGDGPEAWAAVAGGALVLLIGMLAGIATGVARGVAHHIPANGFGLCSGMPGAANQDAMSLTPWLHATLQGLAGRAVSEAPLCFGDLEGEGVADEVKVELRMMTTNLTRHQPMKMPWPEREYYFEPGEFRRLFPAEVVDWMCDHPPALSDASGQNWVGQARRLQALPKLPFPPPEDLPIVVATRMSLSFPGLISAVPLCAVDFTLTENQEARESLRAWRAEHPDAKPEEASEVGRLRYEVNWFSDGGISSNLPVHFFDAPLPTRPTFAVDLAPFPVGRDKARDQLKNSHLPEVNQGGLSRRWTRWDSSGLGAVAAFARSIVDTARSWVDQAQLVMPGYRDRIVTIYHDKAEGGINLNMKADVVADLVARGRGGASRLVDRFVAGDGWDNHRWIRFRTAGAGLDAWLGRFQHGYTFPAATGTPYAKLAGSNASAPLPSYAVTGARRDAVNLRTDALLTLAAHWRTAPADAFTSGSPRPRPVLRLVPGEILDQPHMTANITSAAADGPGGTT